MNRDLNEQFLFFHKKIIIKYFFLEQKCISMKEYFVCFLFKRNLSETKKQNKLYFLFKVASIDELAWSQKTITKRVRLFLLPNLKRKRASILCSIKTPKNYSIRKTFFPFYAFLPINSKVQTILHRKPCGPWGFHRRCPFPSNLAYQ